MCISFLAKLTYRAQIKQRVYRQKVLDTQTFFKGIDETRLACRPISGATKHILAGRRKAGERIAEVLTAWSLLSTADLRG
jgi:hypothetical protein